MRKVMRELKCPICGLLFLEYDTRDGLAAFITAKKINIVDSVYYHLQLSHSLPDRDAERYALLVLEELFDDVTLYAYERDVTNSEEANEG